VKKWGFIVLALLNLSACHGYFSNGEDFYLRSRNGVKVAVPPPLTNATISSFYDLPPQTEDPRVSTAPPVTT
jgi:uncharacterized lipoprotein